MAPVVTSAEIDRPAAERLPVLPTRGMPGNLAALKQRVEAPSR
jgi:hypothetical protein